MYPMPNSQNNLFEMIVKYFFASIQCIITPSKLNEFEHLNIAVFFVLIISLTSLKKWPRGMELMD